VAHECGGGRYPGQRNGQAGDAARAGRTRSRAGLRCDQRLLGRRWQVTAQYGRNLAEPAGAGQAPSGAARGVGSGRGQGRRRAPAVARHRGLAANRERWPAQAGPRTGLDRDGDPDRLWPDPDRERAACPGRRDQASRPRRPPGPEMARIPLGPLVPDLGHLYLLGAMAVPAGQPRPLTRPCNGAVQDAATPCRRAARTGRARPWRRWDKLVAAPTRTQRRSP
jgi:hypothetical protein